MDYKKELKELLIITIQLVNMYNRAIKEIWRLKLENIKLKIKIDEKV